MWSGLGPFCNIPMKRIHKESREASWKHQLFILFGLGKCLPFDMNICEKNMSPFTVFFTTDMHLSGEFRWSFALTVITEVLLNM